MFRIRPLVGVFYNVGIPSILRVSVNRSDGVRLVPTAVLRSSVTAQLK